MLKRRYSKSLILLHKGLKGISNVAFDDIVNITLGLATIGIILSKQRITKLLIRLCGYTVWSEPLIFTYGINRFSYNVAHLIPNMVIFKKFNPK